MIPGWYDDPFAAMPDLLRWWDGTTWTSHVTSKSALAPAPAPAAWALFAPDPHRDLEDELRSARFARIAVVVAAVLTAVTALSSGWLFSGLRRQLREIMDGNDTTTTNTFPHGGRVALLYLVQFAGLGLSVFLMIWLFRAATLARRAGLPARREPVWAIVGFLVPVVNLWFPYQVAADCLRPDDPHRRLVSAWWAFQIGQLVLGASTGAASVFSASVALVLGIATAVCAGLYAYTGVRMIDAIGGAHRRLLAPT